MTLPSSGTMTSAQLAQELYGSSGAAVTVPDSATRTLTGKSTGALVFPTDFYGKSKGISLASVSIPSDRTNTGFIKGSYGSVSPAFANVNPAASPSSGAAGEIIQLDWIAAVPNDPGYPAKLTLFLNGTYASAAALPFTTLDIDSSVTLNKSTAAFLSSGGATSLAWTLASNPIPAGSHSLVFA